MWPRAKDESASGRSGDRAPTGLIGWRRELLLRAGFDAELASRIASNCVVDLHALIELVEQGCPPPLATRILAPLDQERRPC